MAGSPGVGRALVRMARRTRPTTPDNTPETRAQILSFVLQAAGPVTVEQICEHTGMHANTVRGHLEVLLAADQVEREPGERSGRGRPPWQYRAPRAETVAAADLRRMLDEEFGDAPDQAIIDDAARRWAAAAGHRAPATTTDEAVTAAAQVLTELGFDAVQSPLGDQLALSRCPYAELVHDLPVICDIHTALLSDLLETSGQDVRVASMEVFPRPGVCLARLQRPDIAAEWTVVPEPRSHPPAEGAHPPAEDAHHSAEDAPRSAPDTPPAPDTPAAQAPRRRSTTRRKDRP